jgi:hypothetical protein
MQHKVTYCNCSAAVEYQRGTSLTLYDGAASLEVSSWEYSHWLDSIKQQKAIAEDFKMGDIPADLELSFVQRGVGSRLSRSVQQ